MVGVRVDWLALSVLNALYSTFVLGGILWFKMHRLRVEVREDYEAVLLQIEPMTVGAQFLREHLDHIEEAQATQEAHLKEIEGQLSLLCQLIERPGAGQQ